MDHQNMASSGGRGVLGWARRCCQGANRIREKYVLLVAGDAASRGLHTGDMSVACTYGGSGAIRHKAGYYSCPA
jgi:hypothetical protein